MYFINPQLLIGPWDKGFALDFLGVKSDTTGKLEKTEIGEASFLLKFKNRYDLVEPISRTINKLLINKEEYPKKIDCIIAVPPSNLNREKQPVFEIGKFLSIERGIKFSESLVEKIKITPEIKDLDNSIRKETVKDVFKINKSELSRYNTILIIDDLYSSGSTATELVNTIKENNKNILVYLITLIKSDSACMRSLE